MNLIGSPRPAAGLRPGRPPCPRQPQLAFRPLNSPPSRILRPLRQYPCLGLHIAHPQPLRAKEDRVFCLPFSPGQCFDCVFVHFPCGPRPSPQAAGPNAAIICLRKLPLAALAARFLGHVCWVERPRPIPGGTTWPRTTANAAGFGFPLESRWGLGWVRSDSRMSGP